MAPLHGIDAGVLGIPKHPHFPEADIFLPQNAASEAMVWLEDGKMRAPEIGSRDQPVTSHTKKTIWGNQYLHQTRAETLSFKNLGEATKLLHQSPGIELGRGGP